MTINWLIIVFIWGLSCSYPVIAANVTNSEESMLLKEVLDQYSPSMAVAFLHERIRAYEETVKKVKSNFNYANQSEMETLDLAQKSLTILDQHLTALEKADYFDLNGTEKVKQLIEQFTMSIEMFPVQLDAQVTLEMNNTVDQLLANLNVISNDLLINQTNEIIQKYIDDLEEKETSEISNRIQRLSATLAKAKILPLLNYSYSEPAIDSRCSDYYYRREYDCETIYDKRQDEIENNLKQLKKIVDLFYSKFDYLGDPNKPLYPKIIDRKENVKSESEPSSLPFFPKKPQMIPIEEPVTSVLGEMSIITEGHENSLFTIESKGGDDVDY